MSLILSGSDGLSDVDGSASTPAIRGTDANTGIFFGADIIGFSEGGAECARFNADSQFVAAAGTASLPVLTTTGDLNTGVYFPGADRIGFSEGGTQVGEFDASGNFLFNSGYGSAAIAYGCRAWVNFNGTGTVAIRASGNVSSITDNGVGLYTVNFTTALPDTNYLMIGSLRRNNGSVGENNANVNVVVRGLPAYTTAFTTTAVQIISNIVTNEGVYDADYIAVAIFR